MRDHKLTQTAPCPSTLHDPLHVGLRVSVEGNRVTAIRPEPDDVFSRGHICPKGPALRELHDDPDRLRTPVRRSAKGWDPIGWDEAIDEVAQALRRVRARHGRDAVGFYVGNPTVHSHRAALGAQLLTAALGTRDYHRIRIGIGRPPGRMDPADFVLRDFSAAERKELPEILGRAADSVRILMERGLAVAQNEMH